MNIKIKITTPAANAIDDLSSIIGAIVNASIHDDIKISGEITEITTDDGTIIDGESIIIDGTGIKGDPSIIKGSIAREGVASRGSLIQPGIA